MSNRDFSLPIEIDASIAYARRWESDPVREAVLDLATETWSMRVVGS
jgi:hypothetical protein